MSHYKDIGKSSKELFEDDYFLIKKFQVKTTNNSKIEVTTEGELLPKGANASLSIARKVFPLSLDKLKIKSNGRIQLDGSLKTNEYSKFFISVEDGRQEPGKPYQSFGKFGYELNHPSSKFGLISDIDLSNGPLLKTSIAYKLNPEILIGTECLLSSRFDDKSRGTRYELTDANIGVSYKGPEWIVSAKTSDLMRAVRLAYLHVVTPLVTIGTIIDYKFKLNSQKMALASQINLDDKSTVKAKIDSGALLTGSFIHKLSDHVKMTLCAEVRHLILILRIYLLI